MSTKEKIELEALELFSIYGYTGVSIRDIAGKVGIKESSIYKHYKSKDEIFQTIIENYQEKTNIIFSEVTSNPSKLAAVNGKILIQMIKTTFRAFAENNYISKCRKMFMISSPGNESVGKLYVQNFITDPIKFNTEIFQYVIKASERKELDAMTMAYHFYSPVFCLLQEFDNGIITMEDAIDTIEKITGKFIEVNRL